MTYVDIIFICILIAKVLVFLIQLASEQPEVDYVTVLIQQLLSVGLIVTGLLLEMYIFIIAGALFILVGTSTMTDL